MKKRKIEAAYTKVLAAFEAVGYPPEVVNSWAISENDVQPFCEHLIEADPKTVLEVGTYVGVSTLLMALLAPKAKIYTVDPNFPLSVEMGATGSNLGKVDATRKTQEIGLAAAKHLGVEDRVVFVEGGFSIGETFSSKLADPGDRVPVVGPDLIEEQGPFDFVFIDGLHTSDAVAKDVALAARGLAEGGVITLHDCVGYWGFSVRAGVFEFLETHPDFVFTHPPYSRVYEGVGTIRRRDDAPQDSFRGPLTPDDVDIRLARSLAILSAKAFHERPVLEFSHGVPAAAEALREYYLDCEYADLAKKSMSSPGRVRARLGDFAEKHGQLSVFSATLLDQASEEMLLTVFEELKARKGSALLAGTPPGEHGAAGPFSRPLATVIAIARKAGLNVFAVPILDQEPQRYAMLPEPRPLTGTSWLINALLVTAQKTFTDASGRDYAPLTAPAARDREQAELSRVHLAQGFRGAFRRSQELQALEADTARRLEEVSEQYRSNQKRLDEVSEFALASQKRMEELEGEYRGQIEALNHSLGTQSEEREQLEKELRALIEERESQLESRALELDEVRESLRQQTKLADQRAGELGRLEQALADFRSEAQSARESMRADHEAALARLREAMAETQSRLDEQTQRATGLHNELADAKATARELRERLEEEQRRRETIESERDQLRGELGDARRERTEAAEAYGEKLSAALKEAEARKDEALREAREEFERKLSEQETRREAELEKIRSEIDERAGGFKAERDAALEKLDALNERHAKALAQERERFAEQLRDFHERRDAELEAMRAEFRKTRETAQEGFREELAEAEQRRREDLEALRRDMNERVNGTKQERDEALIRIERLREAHEQIRTAEREAFERRLREVDAQWTSRIERMDAEFARRERDLEQEREALGTALDRSRREFEARIETERQRAEGREAELEAAREARERANVALSLELGTIYRSRSWRWTNALRRLLGRGNKDRSAAAERVLASRAFDSHGDLIHELAFNPEYYRRQVDGLSGPVVTIAHHYVEEGEAAGLRPNAVFDPAFYLRENPDVAKARMPALLHFIEFGLAEGRSPSEEFHPLKAKADAAGVPPADYLRDRLRKP